MAIYSVEGRPVAGKEILRRLKEIDPHLGLMFAESPLGNRWHITFWWPENDPRWQRVKEGQADPAHAFDMIATLPEDCSPDEAYSFIVRSFTQMHNRSDIHDMLDRVHRYNKKRQDEIMQPVRDLGDELVETNAPTLFRDFGKTTTRFYQSGGKDAQK